ncbi:hypothetical protein [Sphingomonas sp.]|uniref:hypothetical protein n=1 Tax=Sphingomonas sp. TaxID=28214 RepID=UPI003B0088DC
MSALDELMAGERALIAALDADDANAIERASAEVAAALPRLGEDDASRDQAEEAMRLAHTARAMLNLLSDRTERRLGRLTAETGIAGPATYGRNARLRR